MCICICLYDSVQIAIYASADIVVSAGCIFLIKAQTPFHIHTYLDWHSLPSCILDYLLSEVWWCPQGLINPACVFYLACLDISWSQPFVTDFFRHRTQFYLLPWGTEFCLPFCSTLQWQHKIKWIFLCWLAKYPTKDNV